MPIFGKDNRDDGNRDLLHQILRELGELRQQVTGQQHAIDQIRHDTTAAINTGLTETRAVVRDGLERHREAIGDPLASIGTELVSVRAAINDLARSIPQPQAAPPAVEDSDLEPADDQQPKRDPAKLLKGAAGISAAELQMHRDAWAFLVEHAAGDRHFHVPGVVDEEKGLVTVRVSGPSIVAALTSLDRVSRTDADPGTRAIAEHLYTRFADTVQEILKNLHRGEDATAVKIVIDDRAKPASDED